MQRLSGFPFAPWFLDRIKTARRIALMTHLGPDADGLGSQVAFAAAANAAGRDVIIVNEDALPDRYGWLDPDGSFGHFERDHGRLEDVDLGIVFDTHTPARAGRPFTALSDRGVDVLVFDHHAVTADADVQGVVATEFSSTGELCYRLLQALQWPVGVDSARGIYAAISFDTGSFRFLRNQANTMRVAAELLETGLDTNPIQEALFASRPADETVLLGRILERIKFNPDRRIAWVITPSELGDGLNVGRDAYGVAIPFVVGIEGVLAAAMLKPGREAGEWKLSLRSKTAVKVGHIAVARGGGGHAHAAGATLVGDPEELMREVVAEIELALEAA